MTFAKHLNELGLTQAQFARLLRYLGGKPGDIGVADRAAVSRWVHGKFQPNPAVIAFAVALKHVPKRTVERWLKEAKEQK